jgi:hypothetical protein
VPAPAATAPSPTRPVADQAKAKALPFNSEVTPSVDRLWDKITEGVFKDPGTLQGVGLPAVEAAKSAAPLQAPVDPSPAPVDSPAPRVEPSPAPRPVDPSPLLKAALPVAPKPPRPSQTSVDDLDALANALTEASPSPAPVKAPQMTQVMAAVAVPAPAEPAESAVSEPGPPPVASRPTLTSQGEARSSVVPSRVSALKTMPPTSPPLAKASSSGFLRWVLVAGVAFGVAYVVVSILRPQAPQMVSPPAAPAPAAS